MNVRIPPTPAMLLRLIRDFSLARDIAEVHGEPWPESLDAWADLLESRREAV